MLRWRLSEGKYTAIPRDFWNVTVTENIMCKSTCLSFWVLLLWCRRGKVWVHGIIVDVPEPTVNEGHCYKIKLPSDSINIRNCIHVNHMHVPAKTFLTDTNKILNLTLYLYLNLHPDQSHLVTQIQVQITNLLAVYQMNVRGKNLDLRLRRRWLVHQSSDRFRVSMPPKRLDL